MSRKKMGLFLFGIIGSFCIYFCNDSGDIQAGRFLLEPSDGYPFHYTLVDTKESSTISFLVNKVVEKKDYIYFSYIDGALLTTTFCYYDPHLKLARINKLKDKIEEVPIQSNEEIFKLVNHISKSDQQWLSSKTRDCNKLPKESDE